MSNLKTGITEAVRPNLDPNIPEERVEEMVSSVKAGFAIAVLGVIVMAVGLAILFMRLSSGEAPWLVLAFAGVIFLFGLALFGAGMNTVSKQVFSAAIKSLQAPLEMVLRFWKAFRNGNGAPPAGPTS